MTDFIHLRVFSSYSLACGALKIEDITRLTKQKKMPAIAVTDINNLFGSLEFALACVENNIKPITGCQLRIKIDDLVANIVLYAMDEKGLLNLFKLASEFYTLQNSDVENYITYESLKEQSEGLIALSAGIDGHICHHILNEQFTKAEQLACNLKNIFADRFYLEISRHGHEQEINSEEQVIKIALSNNIPLVATNKVFFSDESMYESHDTLLCIANGTYTADLNRQKSHTEYYFKTQRQMKKLFADLPEAIENTVNIAKRCNIMAEKRKPLLPKFTKNATADEASELKNQARNGLEQKLKLIREGISNDKEFQELKQKYEARLEYELSVIIDMDFPGYFLIVSDFIKWSKRNSVPVGPGRGSGAGSAVAWALEITDLDPIKFGLLFERFLNPERISMPDFDIDFCQEKRETVIKYVQEKYGHDRVAQIITFGKLQARAVVRDVGRALQMPYSQVDRISKMVPFNPVNPPTLSDAIKMEPMLAKARKEDPQINQLLTIALKLEGLNRHASTHAAGIVIADRKLHELVPLYRDPKSEMIVSQYSMKYAEAAGLVKFDFLGLKTLTVIAHTLKFLSKSDIHLDMNKLPLDDPKTYEMLSKGDSVGVFQFESVGMRDSLRKLKPDSINDIMALGALYRPGPMDNIPTYIARKHGLENPNYPHEKLESVLKETFGVIIYQEQVIEIAKILAGYSLGAADLLRRAMGKKIKSEMDAQRKIFISGAKKNGLEESHADEIFDLVAKFAGYGFNKSHAAAYGMISYQTAYLKANHTVEFITALLNLDINDTDKIALFCEQAKKHNISVLPPCVNDSESYFFPSSKTDEKDSIRFALGALKNVGINVMEKVVQERLKNGPYSSLTNFLKRNDNKLFNKRSIENLIKSGAFDCFEYNRAHLLSSVENILKFASLASEEKTSNQFSLFASTNLELEEQDLNIIKAPSFPKNITLTHEYEAFGFYLNSHPLDEYKEILALLNVKTFDEVSNNLEIGTSKVKLAGVAISTRIRSSARGRYLIANLSDASGIYDATIFRDEILANCRELLEGTDALIIEAEARKDDGGVRLTINNIERLNDFLKLEKNHVTLHINKNVAYDDFLEALKKYKKGDVSMSLRLKINSDKEITLKLGKNFDINFEELKKLVKLACIEEFEIA